jgi:hypothetical protein
MKLTLQELNEMYYCLSVAITHHSEHPLMKVDSLNKLIDKVRDELDRVIYETESN